MTITYLTRFSRLGVGESSQGEYDAPAGGKMKASAVGHRALAGIGATAVALACVLLAPATAANAASKQSISGTVSEAATGSWTLGEQLYHGAVSGNVELFTSGCDKVGTARVSWNGTKFAIAVPKSGKYKFRYVDATHRTTNSVPYGLSTTWFGGGVDCAAARTISVGSGKKVTGQNVTVRAAGALQATGATLKSTSSYSDRYLVYSAKSGKRIATLTSSYAVASLPSGSYRVAVGRYVPSTKKTTVIRVFGTSSKSVGRGKTVTVSAAKALQVSFSRGKASTVKDYRSTRLGLAGSGEVATALKAKFTSLPSGTSVGYRWKRDADTTIGGATASSFTVRAADICHAIYVSVTLRKSGYLNRSLTSAATVAIPAVSATQWVWTCTDSPLVPEDNDGEHFSGAKVGDTLVVTPAVLEPAATKIRYAWGVDSEPGELGDESTFEIDPAYNGRTIQVTVTYLRTGLTDVVKTSYISVETTIDGEELPDLTELTAATFQGDLTDTSGQGYGYDFVAKVSAPLAVDQHATFQDENGAPLEVDDPDCAWDHLDSSGAVVSRIRAGSCMLSTADLEAVLAAPTAGAPKLIQLTVIYRKTDYQDYQTATRFLVEAD